MTCCHYNSLPNALKCQSMEPVNGRTRHCLPRCRTTQNNELKWRQKTEEYIKKSIIKRSVNAVAPVEDTNGTCKRSPTNHASKTANGWWIDYDCNGICTSKTSKGNCLDIHTYCDYQHSSGSGQRSNARLDSACEWVPN